MTAPERPRLETLAQKPTWVNRAGRVDRSALIEIRASDIWRKATFHPAPIKNDPAAPTAFAVYTLTAPFINALHATRRPFVLDGDYRTQKSNAMKDHRYPAPRTGIHNPNRGASRTKMLCLNAEGNLHGMWQFTVRIERRHRVSKRAATSPSRRSVSSSHAPPRGRGGSPPSHQHMLICPRCENAAMKLFLVLCTNEEARDAEFAEGWINMLDHRAAAARQTIPADLIKFRAKLIERYALLFHKRRPLCRTCLGVRYGEAKTRKGTREPFPTMHSDRPYYTNRPW